MSSCTKDDLAVMGYSFNNDSSITKAPKYYKGRACVITEQNLAGILCEPGNGTKCKRPLECEAIPQSALQYFSASEQTDWLNVNFEKNRPFLIKMSELGYFYHPDSIQ